MRPSRQSRQLISLALAGLLLAPVVIAAVVRSACRDDPFVRHYTTVALNLQVAPIATIVLCMITVPIEVPVFVIFFVLYGVVWIYGLGASFVSDRKARTGVLWSPPLIPFFRP